MKKIVFLSNACLDQYDNSLTKFINTIPANFLDKHKTYNVAIESLGFSPKYRNKVIPINDRLPSLIHITRQEMDTIVGKNIQLNNVLSIKLEKFHNRNLIFLNDLDDKRSYSNNDINHFIRRKVLLHYSAENASNFFGVPCQYNKNDKILEFGQYHFRYDNDDEKKKKTSYLLFHELFFNELKLNHKLNDFIMIENEKFYWFWNGDNISLKSTNPLGLIDMKPKIIQIKSNNITPVPHNNSLKPIVKVFAPPKNKKDFLHIDFENMETHKIATKELDYFEIELLDEHDNRLSLQQGSPSYLKAHFWPENDLNMNDQFNIHVSSEKNQLYPLNQTSRFQTKLAESLDFTYQKHAVALSSITFHNSFAILKSLNLTFQVKKQVHHGQNDLRIHEEGVIEIPSYLQSIEDIVAFFKDSINNFVKFEKTRILSMIFKEGATIKISKNLAFILGINIVDDYLLISKQMGESYTFPNEPQNMQLHPPCFYVHSNICDYSILGGMHSRLLKIVPIKQEKLGEYVTIEFDKPEFLDLSFTNITILDFDIRGGDGYPIVFNDTDSNVYITLTFQKK